MKKAYVFPGQGSQRKGMGENLFEEFPELTRKANEILGYSIKELCLSDPDQKLNLTQYTQPAMYVVNALSYQKKMKDGEKEPDFLAGHSLGEYNALHAAGVISFEDGLKLVKRRGELMSQARDGGMAAILDCSEERVRRILKEANLTTIDIANLNSPSQIVISGVRDDVNKAQFYFEKANAMFIPLNTSGAFHSRCMKEAENEYEKFIRKVKFSKPNIEVVANVTGKPYGLEDISQNLIHQLSSCVRWSDSVMYLLSQGVTEFEELGVGDVLTKLIAWIKKGYNPAESHNVQSQVIAEESKQERTVAKTDTSKTGPPIQKEKVRPLEHAGMGKQTDQLDAKELVQQWNRTCPVGTRVISDFYETTLETRTEATILFGHRAAVYMKGYNGYFDLREVKPAN